jgi:hypothetical protein
LAQISGNSGWLSVEQQNGEQTPAAKPGDGQMQTLSFIVALAFMLVYPAFTGNSDNGRPGIGTFAYNGSPIAVSVSQPIVLATR